VNADDRAPDLADQPGSPAEMDALLRAQQRSVVRQSARAVPVILAAWGIAWLVGFGLMWLAGAALPGLALTSIWVFVALNTSAVAASAIVSARGSRGIRLSRESGTAAALYGVTWVVGILAIALFGWALALAGMTDDVALLFYPIAWMLFVGIMHIVAGAVWRVAGPAVLGGWVVLVSLGAAFAGHPADLAVLALGAGGAFLAAAIVAAVWIRR